MDRETALAVTAAVLVALLTKLAPTLGISPVVCLVAFGVYFAAGGKLGGLIKALASMIAGALWQLLSNMLLAQVGGLYHYRWALFGIVALLVVWQSRFTVLSSLPGGLCGAAMAVRASSLRPDGILVGTALILGAVAGFLAEATAGMVAKKA
jgi:hypothetical protein